MPGWGGKPHAEIENTIVGVSPPRWMRRPSQVMNAAAHSKAMKNPRRNKKYSAVRERLKREDAAEVAKLTPAERLQAALDLSDFCLMLAAKVRETDAQRSITKGRHGAR